MNENDRQAMIDGFFARAVVPDRTPVCEHLASLLQLESRGDYVDGRQLPMMCCDHPEVGMLCAACMMDGHLPEGHVSECRSCGRTPAGVPTTHFPWEISAFEPLRIHWESKLQSAYSGRVNVVAGFVCGECD